MTHVGPVTAGKKRSIAKAREREKERERERVRDSYAGTGADRDAMNNLC